mmetsp:Transcript_21035/g.55705  ORF Transcript_21035/g.55705 Transcript_21035/m.55705 type:complete len:786 (-) Transcript_21035:60-2417(-)
MWGGKPNPNWNPAAAGAGQNWNANANAGQTWNAGNQGGQIFPAGQVASQQPRFIAPRGPGTGMVAVAPSPAQAQALAVRQAKEAEMNERRAELQAKREEENGRRQEHAAAIIVRKVIQRIRVVQPETFDTLRMELETAMSEQLEKMGSMAEKIQQEAEKELLEAQTRVDTLNEKRAEEEKTKADAEAKKFIQAETAEKMVKDAQTLVLDAEHKLEYASTACSQMEEALKTKGGDAHDGALKAAHSAADLVQVAQTAITDASKELAVTWAEVDLPDSLKGNVKKEYKAMNAKIASCRQNLSRFSKLVKDAKDQEVRRATALNKEQAKKDLFGKYDSCGAGLLNQSDVRTFAKEVYGFDIPDAHLERIHTKLRGEKGGVPYEAFQRLRAKVAIEHSCTAAREAMAKEEEKLARFAAKKQEFKELLVDAEKALEEAQESATSAEAATKPLTGKNIATASCTAIKENASKVDGAVAAAKEALERATTHLDAVAPAAASEGEDEEIVKFQKKALEDIKGRVKKVQALVDRSINLVKSARGRLQRKEFAEVEALRIRTITSIGNFMDAKEFTLEQLHSHMSGGAEGGVKGDAFVVFMKGLYESLGDKLDGDDASQYRELFKHVGGDAEVLTLQGLTEMLYCTYRVAKATMLSDGHAIDSKGLRRLEEGEHVQGLDCPRKHATSGVTRVKCKAMKDDVEGWVSVQGNKGSVFLEPCSKYLACLKETVITAELDVSSDTVRKLNKDELLEVLQFPTKDPGCGVMRVKAKVASDGATGWVSVAGNAGTTFLEAC